MDKSDRGKGRRDVLCSRETGFLNFARLPAIRALASFVESRDAWRTAFATDPPDGLNYRRDSRAVTTTTGFPAFYRDRRNLGSRRGLTERAP